MWIENNNGLERELKFPSFAAAMAFMQSAIPLIEALDHHPEWSNVYNRVSIRLTTHDTGTITDLDRTLAAQLDTLYNEAHGS